MVTYLYETFFFKAKEIDPVSKRPRYPDLYEIAKILKAHPRYGSGSRNGGYVCVCDQCGQPTHTYSKSRRFCDRNCQAEWNAIHKKPMYAEKLGKLYGTVKRKCECCGQVFDIRHSYLPKGRGVFCSEKCYRKLRPLKAEWFICNHCGTQFKALTYDNARFCCNECRNMAPKFGDDSIYIDYVPNLKVDTDEARFNAELNNESIHAYRKENKELLTDEYRKHVKSSLGLPSDEPPKIQISLISEISDYLEGKIQNKSRK